MLTLQSRIYRSKTCKKMCSYFWLVLLLLAVFLYHNGHFTALLFVLSHFYIIWTVEHLLKHETNRPLPSSSSAGGPLRHRQMLVLDPSCGFSSGGRFSHDNQQDSGSQVQDVYPLVNSCEGSDEMV